LREEEEAEAKEEEAEDTLRACLISPDSSTPSFFASSHS